MRQVPENCCVLGPNEHVVELVEKYKPTKYAEIGVYKGDTCIEVAKLLNESSQIHLFDFEDRIEEVVKRFEVEFADRSTIIKAFVWPNSYKMFDSYNWSLAKCLEQGITFDFVFIDGAHSWHHDALAFFLVDRMLEDGGIVVFDDYAWRFGGSPTLCPRSFPQITEQYTQEQIEIPQVNMIVDLLVEKMDYQPIISKVAYQKVKSIVN